MEVMFLLSAGLCKNLMEFGGRLYWNWPRKKLLDFFSPSQDNFFGLCKLEVFSLIETAEE